VAIMLLYRSAAAVTVSLISLVAGQINPGSQDPETDVKDKASARLPYTNLYRSPT